MHASYCHRNNKFYEFGLPREGLPCFVVYCSFSSILHLHDFHGAILFICSLCLGSGRVGSEGGEGEILVLGCGGRRGLQQ